MLGTCWACPNLVLSANMYQACKDLCGAGVAHFLSVMGQSDVQRMPLQQRRSQVLAAVSQLAELSRYGVCLMFAATRLLGLSCLSAHASLSLSPLLLKQVTLLLSFCVLVHISVHYSWRYHM